MGFCRRGRGPVVEDRLVSPAEEGAHHDTDGGHRACSSPPRQNHDHHHAALARTGNVGSGKDTRVGSTLQWAVVFVGAFLCQLVRHDLRLCCWCRCQATVSNARLTALSSCHQPWLCFSLAEGEPCTPESKSACAHVATAAQQLATVICAPSTAIRGLGV